MPDFRTALENIYKSQNHTDFNTWKSHCENAAKNANLQYMHGLNHVDAYYKHPSFDQNVVVGRWDKQDNTGWVQTAPKKN